MRWSRLLRQPEPEDRTPEDARPAWSRPPGWHVLRWDALDVLPEWNLMRGHVTLFHDDGLAYDMYAEDYAAVDARELFADLENFRRLSRRSKLPYKPLRLAEMDDATIRPCGFGMWIRDAPPSPPVAAP